MPEESTLMADAPKTETAPAPWYSDEFKELVTQQGWKDPNDAVRDYRELHKSASGKVKLPTPESSAEEISNFYAKIRGVDTPEGYEVKVPENVPVDEGMINKIKQWAFDAGAPKTAVETVLKNWFQELTDQQAQSIEVAKKELQDEWKDEYNTNFQLADRFVTNEASEDFRALLVETGLNNHPVVAKQMLDWAKRVATDKLIKGEAGETKKDEYVPVYKDSPEMYRNGDDEESKKARAYFEAKGFRY